MKRNLVSVALAVAAILMVAAPVYAFLLNPTSMTVESIKWFRNVVSDGDMVGIFHFKIAYVSYPTVPASTSIVFRLYDTDGLTLKAVNKPYPYVLFGTNGYGDGVSSFYLPPGSGMTWGAAYKINIYGLPLYYENLPSYIQTIAAADWSTANSTMEAQRQDMYSWVLKLCDDLKTVYAAVPLKTATDGEFTLSPYGESYFTGAVPGIYSMCPQLFFAQVYVPQNMETENYSMYLAEQYKERMEGTDLERGGNRVAAHFGLPGEFFWGVVTIVGCIGSCVVCIRKGWGIESGLTVSAGIVILAAVLIGNWMFTIVMVGMLAAAIVLFWILHFKRAA